ncbi:hypothetical protein OFO08_08050, partial [Campylobacter sp. JMF_10 EL2]|nr:hypothetical protein [Campylobacter sp. JMF_14 EL1]MDA3074169.1 hypothetical protein [Campylobacter sp. JMF_10 EL2]
MNKVYKLKRSSHGVKVVSEIAKGHSGEKTVREGFGSTIFSSIGKIASAPALGRLAMSLATIVAISAPFMPSEAEAGKLCVHTSGVVYFTSNTTCPNDTSLLQGTGGLSFNEGTTSSTARNATAWGVGTLLNPNNNHNPDTQPHTNPDNTVTPVTQASTASGSNATAWAGGQARGDYSTAWGFGINSDNKIRKFSLASGKYATAWAGGQATGNYSTAFGAGSVANNKGSTAWNSGQATGAFSTAFGRATAQGDNAVAWGSSGVIAKGSNSVAFGQKSIADGNNAVAFGYETETHNGANNAFTFGKWTDAYGERATAFGLSTVAKGNQSTAFGENTEANATNSTAWGKNSIVYSGADEATAFGLGSIARGKNSLAALGGTTNKENTMAIGVGALANEINTIAFGNNAKAYYTNTIAIGVNSVAGDVTNDNSGATIAIGMNAQALNGRGVAIGKNTKALGPSSVSIGGANGNGAYSYGTGSISIGAEAIADVDSSVQSGQGNIAIGYLAKAKDKTGIDDGEAGQSIAIGMGTVANGGQAMAIGANVLADGYGSIAIGGDDIGGRSSSSRKAEIEKYIAFLGGEDARLMDGDLAISKRTKMLKAIFSGDCKVDGNKLVGDNCPADLKGENPYTKTNASALGSMAIGQSSIASNTFASAVGFTNTASGIASASVGTSNEVLSHGSSAFGLENKIKADDINSTAVGVLNLIDGGSSNALAMGNSNYISGSNFSIAAGYYNENHADNTISVGLYNDANATNASAVGLSNYALGEGSIAVGGLNVAKGDYATAFGLKNNAMADHTLAIGSLNNAKAENSMALGADNNTTAKFSVAAGMSNVAEGEKSAALGFGNVASATKSFSVGMDNNVTVTGVESIAHGYRNKVSGANSIAMGTGNEISGDNSGAFGDPNIISGSGSYATGNDNTINTNNTHVLGNKVTKTFENSVFLGNESAYVTGDTTAANGEVENATVGGVTYGDFAGAQSKGVVSVGDKDKERRIQNVAAGLITKDSTDAINGSQLYAAYDQLQWQVGANTDIAGTVGKLDKNKNRSNVYFVEGNDGIKITATENANGYDVTFAPKFQNATIKNNKIVSIGYNGDIYSVAGDGVDTNTTVVNKDGSVSVTTASALNAEGGREYILSIANQMEANRTEISNDIKNFFGGETKIEGNKTIVTNLGGTGETTIHDAIKKAYDRNDTVKSGDQYVTVERDRNGAEDGNDFTVKVTLPVQYTDDTNSTVTLTNNINGDSVKLTNLADGDISDTSTDAINGSQLKKSAEGNRTYLTVDGGTVAPTDGTYTDGNLKLTHGGENNNTYDLKL